MDGFDLKPDRTKINRKALVWNLLTVVTLLGVICVAYYVFTVFMNPSSRLNLFPPKPLPTLFKTATPTITPIQLAPTWTVTVTVAPPPTRTTAPTWTLLPVLITLTATDTPTITPTPTITNTPAPATADITYKPSTDYHADSDCSWLGVGGQVLDANGKALLYQTVQLGGTLDDNPVTLLRLSGSASAYGKAGFEFILGDHPIASTQTLWLQLFDNTGKPLTDKIYFDTYTDCNQNLVLVTFKFVPPITPAPTHTPTPPHLTTTPAHTLTPTK